MASEIVYYDGHLPCIDFPKVIADFGLVLSQGYYLKHNALHVFLSSWQTSFYESEC